MKLMSCRARLATRCEGGFCVAFSACKVVTSSWFAQVLKKYAYSYTSTKMEECLGFPFAVPVRLLAGGYDKPPTARQVCVSCTLQIDVSSSNHLACGFQIHEYVWKQCKRFLKESVVDEFGLDTKLPYTIHIVKRGGLVARAFVCFS